MSNAMRTGKRTLAGFAAGALALGMLSIAGASTATAAKTIKPKAAVSGTVSPVRVSYTSTALDRVTYASLSWTNTSGSTIATGDTIELAITNAPSPIAKIGIVDMASVGSGTSISTGDLGGTTAVLGTPASAVIGTSVANNDPAEIGIAANEAGTYTGTLTVYASGVADAETVSFGFTTVGAPTALTLTPGTQNVSVNGTGTITAKLTTATGALTQPLFVDAVTTASTPSTGITVQALTTSGNTTNSLFDGSAAFTASPTTAGGYSITATPSGTISGLGAQTVSVVAQTTIAPTGAIIAAPTVGVSTLNTVYTAPAARAAPSTSQTNYVSTTVPTVTFAVSGATAGALVAYSVVDSTANPAGVTDMSGTVTLDANAEATFQVTASAITSSSLYDVTIGASGGNQIVYRMQYAAPGALLAGNLTSVPPAGSQTFTKTGEATPVVATMTNQFGLPVSGVSITATATGTAVTSTASTGADGKATLSIAAPTSSSTTSQTVTMVGTLLGISTAATSAFTIQYNSSGAPTSLTLSSTAGTVAVTAAATQYTDPTDAAATTWANTSVAAARGWMQVTATVGGGLTGVPVTFSGEGLYFAPANTNTFATSTTKAGTYTPTSGTTGGAVSAFVKATKVGTATVKVVTGTLEETITWNVANQSTDGRVLSVTPASQGAGDRAQVTATVTDAFGNPVGGSSLTFSEVGVGNFASGASTLSVTTAPVTGEVAVDVVASERGESTVTVIPNNADNFAGLANAPIAGAPAGVSSGTGKITFTGGSGSKSITIAGSRTTVSGRPGILIEGVTVGIENGKTVIPYFRFPGQTSYTQGSARPVVQDGEFAWQRKTGKKFYAYVTNDDGAVKSNNVIIQAK